MKSIVKSHNLKFVFYCALFLFSGMVAYWCIRWNVTYDATTVSYSYVRVELMEEFMHIIRNGEIPPFLSAYEHSYGYALYLPYIGVFFGVQEGWQLLLWIQLVAMTLLIIILPFLIYSVFRNKIVAFSTPVLLHLFCGNILYGFKTDSFWGMAWTITLTMPLIYLISRHGWNYKKGFLLVAIGLICSLGNVMRNHNGFVPMVLVLCILLYKFLHKELKFIHFLLAIIAFYLFYESISTFLPLIIGTCFGLTNLNNEAFMWHAILCGWGSYPNEYGLACNDEVIAGVVQMYYPYMEYATDEYTMACKKLVFKILFDDPWFVVSTYFSKAVEMLGIEIKYLFSVRGKDYYYFNTGLYTPRNILVPSILAFIIGGCGLVKRGKDLLNTYCSLIIFCLAGIVIGMAQALMMLPDLKYGLSSVMCFSMVPFYICLIGIQAFTDKRWLRKK